VKEFQMEIVEKIETTLSGTIEEMITRNTTELSAYGFVVV
jgi:hypothetical protein